MTQRQILAISGKMRSGKDTFASQFIDHAGPSWRRSPFAYALKAEVAADYDVPVAYTEAHRDEFRPIWIAWGQKRRAEDDLYWVKRALAQPGNLVIPDLRFPNEMAYLKSQGAKLLRVESLISCREQRGVIIEDFVSENQLDGIAVGPAGWDWFAFNNGTLASFERESIKLIAQMLIAFEAPTIA